MQAHSLTTHKASLEHHSQQLLSQLTDWISEAIPCPDQPTDSLGKNLGAAAYRIYEARIQYKLHQQGYIPTLNHSKAIADYMEDIPTIYPTVETFWVIFLDIKLKAIARHLDSPRWAFMVIPNRINRTCNLSFA